MAAIDFVVPPARFVSPYISDTRCRSMVTKSSYYFASYWWNTKNGYVAPTAGTPNISWDSTYNNGVEVNVREACGAAITMAVCADWNGYVNNVGVILNLDDLRLRAARLVVGTSIKHSLFSNGASWGFTWQSGYWAYLLGLAAWLVWDSKLTYTHDRARIADIVEAEADFQLFNHRPEIWKDAYGNLQVTGSSLEYSYYTGGPQGLRSGDSAMEEDIWNSTILDFAACMMPNHPHAEMWRQRAAQYAIVGKVSSNDKYDGETLINGWSPMDWVYGDIELPFSVPQIEKYGFNLDANYVVTNHNRRNPDYMQADCIALANCLTHGLAQIPTPEAYRWNSEKIYGAMQTVQLPTKTMYQPGTPTLYFPDGADWGSARHTGYWAWDSLMETQVTRANRYEDLIPISPTTYDGLHGNAAKAMQDRKGIMPGGQIVYTDTEDKYPGREGWHALHASFIVLNKIMTNAGRITWTNDQLIA